MAQIQRIAQRADESTLPTTHTHTPLRHNNHTDDTLRLRQLDHHPRVDDETRTHTTTHAATNHWYTTTPQHYINTRSNININTRPQSCRTHHAQRRQLGTFATVHQARNKNRRKDHRPATHTALGRYVLATQMAVGYTHSQFTTRPVVLHSNNLAPGARPPQTKLQTPGEAEKARMTSTTSSPASHH